LDYIYAIPNQSKDELLADLASINAFDPNHVSYYSLILEERTVLSHLLSKHQFEEVDQDKARLFGELIDRTLNTYGYEKYEFSNYAKHNAQSMHNLIYWNLEEYLGVGLQASSQFNHSRMVNPSKISDYLEEMKHPILTMHQLERFNPKMEMLLVGLRKTKGVSLEAYHRRFKQGIMDVYPQLRKHIDNQLLEIKDGYLRFTNNGMYLSNQVYMDLIDV